MAVDGGMCDDQAHGHDHLPDHRPDHRQRASAAPLPLNRRSLLAGAGGALLLAGVPGTRAMALDVATGASRRSRLTKGTMLVHADLHNHTLLSDGDGNPDLAFASMREAGLDVAALTDHATLSDNVLGDPLKQALLPTGYSSVAGITAADWKRTSALADAADTPGVFTAIRGFEWSEPTLGHVNVWFTRDYTDVVDVGDMGPLYDWRLLAAGRLPQCRLAARAERRHRRARHRLGAPRGQGPLRPVGHREHPPRGHGRHEGPPLLRHPGLRAAPRRDRGRRPDGRDPADREG